MDKRCESFFRLILNNEDKLPLDMYDTFFSKSYSRKDIRLICNEIEKEGLIVSNRDDSFKPTRIEAITDEGREYFQNTDKPRLLVLLNRMYQIENMIDDRFSIFGGNISWSEEYVSYWYQEVCVELRTVYERKRDPFLGETLNVLEKTDSKVLFDKRKTWFNYIKNRLKVICNNIDKYYPKISSSFEIERKNAVMGKKKPLIFISHSSKDVAYVSRLVELLNGMGLNQTQVFCSSLAGYGIPVGKNIFDYLREQFFQYDLHVIIVHSENYYNSAICLNEMGAAWVLKYTCTSILLPGFGYEQMKGVMDNQYIAIKLDAPLLNLQDMLNQFYDNIISEFQLTKLADIIWQQKRDAFINGCLMLA